MSSEQDNYLINQSKRKTKASIFSDLFSNKKYALQLLQAVSPKEDATSEDDIVSIDPGDIFDTWPDQNKDLCLCVCQDTFYVFTDLGSEWFPNVMIKMFSYMGNILDYFLKSNKVTKIFPGLHFYIFYTGDEEKRDRAEFADHYEDKSASPVFNLKADIIRDGSDNDIVSQYIKFSKTYEEQIKLYGKSKKTVDETLRICAENDVLTEYFTENADIARKIMLEENNIF